MEEKGAKEIDPLRSTAAPIMSTTTARNGTSTQNQVKERQKEDETKATKSLNRTSTPPTQKNLNNKMKKKRRRGAMTDRRHSHHHDNAINTN